MSLGTDTDELQLENNGKISGCTEYKYLGSILTNDGNDTKNIRNKIVQSKRIIEALNGIWWSKNITKNRNNMNYKAMVESVLTYEAETWNISG